MHAYTAPIEQHRRARLDVIYLQLIRNILEHVIVTLQSRAILDCCLCGHFIFGEKT